MLLLIFFLSFNQEWNRFSTNIVGICWIWPIICSQQSTSILQDKRLTLLRVTGRSQPNGWSLFIKKFPFKKTQRSLLLTSMRSRFNSMLKFPFTRKVSSNKQERNCVQGTWKTVTDSDEVDWKKSKFQRLVAHVTPCFLFFSGQIFKLNFFFRTKTPKRLHFFRLWNLQHFAFARSNWKNLFNFH